MKKNKRTIIFIFAFLCLVLSNLIMTISPIGQPLLLQYGDGTGMLDFLSYYSGAQAAASLSSLGAEGTRIYARLLLIDFIFIAATGIVFSMILQAIVRWAKISSKWIRLGWLGYIRSGFDALENILLLIAMFFFANNQSLLNIAGFATLLKWVSMYIYISAAFIVAVVGIVNRRRKSFSL